MVAAFQSRPLIASLAVLAAALVVVIGIELGLGTSLRSALTPAAGKRAVAVEAKLLPPVIATAPEQAYPETARRPLFTPTRRPAPEAPAAVKSAFVPGQFVLQGVTVAGNTRIAMLREKANGRIHRVERGREVNGIQVIEIQPEVVTLGQGGEREVLSLQVQRPAGAPPAAAAAQAGPFAAPAAAQPATGAQPARSETLGLQPPVASPPTRSGVIPMAPGIAAPANPAANPTAREPAAAPMSPEELLARRRARRTQQNQ